jgi:hypothetical protein
MREKVRNPFTIVNGTVHPRANRFQQAWGYFRQMDSFTSKPCSIQIQVIFTQVRCNIKACPDAFLYNPIMALMISLISISKAHHATADKIDRIVDLMGNARQVSTPMEAIFSALNQLFLCIL